MAEVAYAVHTRSCSYLLDEGGVCRWIISPTGMVPPEVRRCVGAQFVACLHSQHPGFLVGELLLSANALFVKLDEDSGRMMLLRTGVIEDVEFHPEYEEVSLGDTFSSEDESAPLTEPAQTLPRPASPARIGSSSDEAGPARRSPPPVVPLSPDLEDSYIDPEDLVQYDEESTVTLTMPLFRPEVQARYLAGNRGAKSNAETGPAPPAPASASDQETLRTPRRPRTRKPWPE